MSDDIPEPARDLLKELSREDVETIKAGLPLVRAVIGFGKVAKWLIVGVLGLFFGAVMLWEALMKVASWFWPPPHP